MIEAASFIVELEVRNRPSIERLVAGYIAGLAKEGFTIADVLRVELKLVIEAAEVAALWMSDSEDLDFKLALAVECGDGALQYRLIWDRLTALGVELGGYDPRQGGYSKLFAFLRSLQTIEERASAGQLTLKSMAIAREAAVAVWCEQQGDVETARLYTGTLTTDQRKHHESGRRALAASAVNEESQARARRAAYRTLELVGELQEPAALRRLLPRPKRV